MIKLMAIFSGVSGFLTVALGAFGAHALKAGSTVYQMEIWQTAVQYQMFHTLVLIALLLLVLRQPANRLLLAAAVFFMAGIVLFSGSLYALVLTDVKSLAMLTPVGGMLLLTGWMAMTPGLYRAVVDGCQRAQK